MSWRERYQQAKFRDVPFKVRNTSTQVGRRTALHEYPQRDEPWAEDLGRKARQFGIEAIVLGPDYDKVRDKLIEALEARGAGLLVHPYYGRRMVALASPARISESPADEGGIARFSLEFVEAGENEQPSERPDTQGQVGAAADRAQAAVGDDFAKNFSVKGKPAFVEASALDRVKGLVTSLDAVRRGMIPDLSIVSDYVNAAKMLSGAAAGLLRAPVDLANSILGLVAGVRGLAIAPLAAIAALAKLFGHGNAETAARPIPRTTPSRIAQANNAAALNLLVQRAAVIEAVRASAFMSFESHDQAVALRDQLGEQLDIQTETASETVYQALLELRVAMVKDITTRGADIARVGHTTLPATLPALVAAYRVYGDAARDGEIIARNAHLVRHPGFVPGGVSLEILRGPAGNTNAG